MAEHHEDIELAWDESCEELRQTLRRAADAFRAQDAALFEDES